MLKLEMAKLWKPVKLMELNSREVYCKEGHLILLKEAVKSVLSWTWWKFGMVYVGQDNLILIIWNIFQVL